VSSHSELSSAPDAVGSGSAWFCAARAARRESVRARGRERRARARTLQKGKGKEGEEEGTSDAPFDQSYSSSSSDARWINGMHDGWRLSKL